MRKKNIVTICMLSLVSFVSCDMNFLDRLIGTISEKFSEEEYYAGLLRRHQEQSDVALKSRKRFKKKSKTRREVIDPTGIESGTNNNVIQDVKELQSVSSQVKASAVVLTRVQQQNESSDLVVPKSPKLIASDTLKPSVSSSVDLESAKKFSDENSEGITMVQQENGKQKLPTENVIDSSRQSDSYQSDPLIQEQDKDKEELFAQESKAREEIGIKIDSVLAQISLFDNSLNKTLSELNNIRTSIMNEKSKSRNFSSNAKQILDKLIQNRNIKKGADLTADIEQFLEQVSNNLGKSIDVADSLYRKQVDILREVKVDAEENLKKQKNHIDSLNIAKVQNSLNNVENMMQKIIEDLGPRNARSKANKKFLLFKQFIAYLEKFDNIIKAGSYDKIDNGFQYTDKDFKRDHNLRGMDKASLYTKLKGDTEINIDNFLRSENKYLLDS